MSIRIMKFKIVGATPEQRKRWKHIANQVKRVTNAIRRQWLVKHTILGNDQRIREFMSDTIDWHKANEAEAIAAKVEKRKPQSLGPRPKNEIKSVTPEIESQIRSYIKQEYPDINSRIIDLVMNAVKGKWNAASSKGSYPKWMTILADDGEFPCSSAPQPIPFDKKNSYLTDADESGDFHIGLRLDRMEVPGRSTGKSTLDVVKMQTKGKNCRSQTAILKQLVADIEPLQESIERDAKLLASEANEDKRKELSRTLETAREATFHKFCGSNLVFKETTGEWFVHVCYRPPTAEKPIVDPGKTAVLRPARNRPWFLRIDGFNFYAGGRSGHHIEHVRRQLLTHRWSRQEGYRHAGSARKGHGRARAIGKYTLLQNRWNDFVKTCNQQLVKEILDRMIKKGVGRIVYFQPTEGETRFLHRAGKVPGRQDGTGWDWYQVGAILNQKCNDLGIVVTVKKSGEQKSQFDKPTKLPAAKTKKVAGRKQVKVA